MSKPTLKDVRRRGGARTARKLPGHVLRIAAFSMVVLAVACAGKEQRLAPDDFNAFRATRLFSVGYHDIADIYIDNVAVADLAMAGLQEVADIAPDLSLERRASRLLVHVKGRTVRTLPVPAANDPDGWGSLTASVLETGRATSPALADKSIEELYETVFGGVMTRLDRYSRYAGTAQARENRANRDGFGGIGVEIAPSDDGIQVLSVMQDSPAASAGLTVGDVIVAIDGQPAAALPRSDAVRRLRGRIDTDVALTIKRERRPTLLQVAVKRAHIVPETVEYRREGDAAYIRITGFNQNTAVSVRRALDQAHDELGHELAGYVLDLRDNPGGLLDQAVEVSDIFVSKGRIVSTHGRHPDSHQYFDAEPDDLAGGHPVIVLVNAASASASEIVAAALQDSGRAVVIGSASFGKGTVQTVLRLPNQGELTLTWARFHAPSGYALSRRGVMPNVCTSGELHSPKTILGSLRGGRPAFSRPVASPHHSNLDAIAALREQCPGRRDKRAIDLDIALRLIHDRELYLIAAGEQRPRLAQIGD